MILTIGNTKGGVGASTLSVQVAIALAGLHRKVLLIDGDRQGTSFTAIGARSQADQSPRVSCYQLTDGHALLVSVRQQRARWDDIVLDVGSGDSAALRAALVLGDTTLIPFGPGAYDQWALNDMVSLVKDAQEVRDGLRVLAILNLVDPTDVSIGKTLASAAARAPQFRFLPFPVHRRKAFALASAGGLGVHELSPRDAKACDEIDGLVMRLLHPLRQQTLAPLPPPGKFIEFTQSAPDGVHTWIGSPLPPDPGSSAATGRMQRIPLEISTTLLRTIDDVARRSGDSRSDIITRAVYRALSDQGARTTH